MWTLKIIYNLQMFLKSINISKLLWEHQLNALTVKITGARTYGVPDQQNPDSR